MNIPTEGRPTEPTSSEDLVGVDGNAFSIMGTTATLLRRAGASALFVDTYMSEALAGDYQHVLATSMAYLDAGAGPTWKGFGPEDPTE